ncbi:MULTISPECIES: hypothetical protein [Acinetobacter]|uniref:hypothetical protein n=1 Tax=Acinetobacter TaxID=469 RepID=UPI0009493B63|nr:MULTISPECIES: hypothetical protein [Acinetobacter]APR70906.1 hypothetical protein AHTJS_11365 [Acinetobacter haemolyticus]UTO21308.1 hypothetical protein NGC85_17120 [Acinetobacter sp. Z1]
MNVNTLRIQNPLLTDKAYKVVVAVIAIVVIGLIYLFANEAYNGVLLKLKLCLILQLFLVISLQLIAYVADKITHIKIYSLLGFVLLFFSSFYLDNFFYGNVAGNFLRYYVVFAALQVLIIWASSKNEG